MEKLRENIESLLDYEGVPANVSVRAEYLSSRLELAEEDIRIFLDGTNVLPKGAAKNIADLFEVDFFWLAGKDS